MSYSDRHYGAGDPNCPICGGVGYFCREVPEDHPDFGKAFDCKCRRMQVNAQRRTYPHRLGELEFFADKTLTSFNPEGVGLPPKYRENLRWAYERVAAYAAQPEDWLVLIGGHGCGKTHLAAAIANAQIEAGNLALFVSVADLLDYLRAAFDPSLPTEEGYDARFEEVRTAPLLILDELGAESQTTWANEKLYRILNHRYVTHLPTVITTTQRLEYLEEGLRSRLSDMDISQIVTITAPDYRGQVGSKQSGLKGLGLYAHMTFETFNLRSELPQKEQNNLRSVLETAKAFALEPGGWLVFLGLPNCGKTHLAAAIANAQVERPGSPEVTFVTVPDLLDHLRAAFAPNVPVPYNKRFEEIRTAPLLILDDLRLSSSPSPWAQEKLHQIVDYRYTGALPTVIASPHKLEEIEQLDLRLATRLRDKRLCRIVAITAPAYLGERQGKAQS